MHYFYYTGNKESIATGVQEEIMVIVESAVIGAAGYGIYRGGEESVKKSKQAKKEFKFGQKLKGQRNELAAKNKARSERIAQINMMRSGRNDSHTTTSSSRSDSAWPFSASTRSKSTSTLSTRPADDSVQDRQKAVMAKLSKKPKEKKGMFGMFKKK